MELNTSLQHASMEWPLWWDGMMVEFGEIVYIILLMQFKILGLLNVSVPCALWLYR